MRLLISAGEASGEMYGAQLIEALRRRVPDLECFGVGGERMLAAGCELIVQSKELAVVGITEILPRLPKIYAEFRKLVRSIDDRKPDAAILIDSPAFHFKVARELHRRGVPVIYYVAPQLWAWRSGRVRLVKRYFKKALVIFPFEEQWYRERGVDAEYVGHPLADLEKPSESLAEFLEEQGYEPDKPIIALMPGSRHKEIRMNLPALLRTAELLGCDYQFVLPIAPTIDPWWLDLQVQKLNPSYNFILFTTPDRRGLAYARAAVVASGTATVEAAMMGTPMVVVYRVSPVTWRVGRPLVHVKNFAMVNLIAGEQVVPELIQANFTAENVAAKLREILPDGPVREKMKADLAQVRARLKSGSDSGSAADRAADAVLRTLA
ncbi:MAG: lipid-A-disaccharide synthase [Terriglobales bacterium]